MSNSSKTEYFVSRQNYQLFHYRNCEIRIDLVSKERVTFTSNDCEEVYHKYKKFKDCMTMTNDYKNHCSISGLKFKIQ